jgi:hypothetical protein
MMGVPHTPRAYARGRDAGARGRPRRTVRLWMRRSAQLWGGRWERPLSSFLPRSCAIQSAGHAQSRPRILRVGSQVLQNSAHDWIGQHAHQREWCWCGRRPQFGWCAAGPRSTRGRRNIGPGQQAFRHAQQELDVVLRETRDQRAQPGLRLRRPVGSRPCVEDDGRVLGGDARRQGLGQALGVLIGRLYGAALPAASAAWAASYWAAWPATIHGTMGLLIACVRREQGSAAAMSPAGVGLLD